MLSLFKTKPEMESALEKPSVISDTWLVLTSITLLALGLLMVASASMPVSEDRFNQPFYYLIRQSMAVGIGLVLAVTICLIPVRLWLYTGLWLLFGVMLLLVLVLIPGIGREINNSTRWISLGFFTLQPSEIAKLSVIIYIAGFLHRHGDAVRLNLRDAIGPVLLLTGLVVLLLKEPDYGAAVVLIVTVMGMMFLAKVNIWHFVVLLGGAAGTMVAVLSLAEYRWLRLMCFLDPWSDPYGCGYQLTQSLIAVGSGGIFGAGLGASIQKLHYLPEAYNDFLFAVLAEELGLVGVISVVGLYSIMIWRMFRISANAEKLGNPFSSYLVSGVALLFGAQTLINMGVNLGLLPPKGLTLPLMSYGGSSMLIMCIALALVLRVAWENCDSNPRRWRKTPVSSRESNSRTASVPVTIGSMDA